MVSLGKCIWPLGHFPVHPLCQTKCHCPFCEAGRQTRRHGGSMQRRGEQAEARHPIKITPNDVLVHEDWNLEKVASNGNDIALIR